MTFQKEPRYVITRIHDNTHRRVFLNGKGEETELPTHFGASWTSGEPERLTLTQANKVCRVANEELGPWLRGDQTESLWRVHPYSHDMSWNF